GVSSIDDTTSLVQSKAVKTYVDTATSADTLTNTLNDKFAKLDASNLDGDTNKVNREKWQKVLGDGKNEANDKGLITGGTLNTALSDYTKSSDLTDKLSGYVGKTDTLFTGIADGSQAGQEIKAGGELKFLAGDNIVVSSDKDGITYGLSKTLTNINSISTENKTPLTITAGDNKTYTFGDTDLGDTSVITKKTLDKEIASVNGSATKPMTFVGDDGDKAVKLGENFNIKGGQGDKNKLSTGANIGVVADSDGLKIKLTKELTDLTSVTTGDTKMDTNGITIGDGIDTTTLTKDGLTIASGPTLNKDGLNMNGKAIAGLKSGLAGLGADGQGGTMADYNNLDDSKKAKYKNNAATIGDLASVDTKVTNITNISNNINNIIGGNVDYIDNNGKLTKTAEDALTTNAASGQEQVKNTNIIQAINNINKQGTRFFHVNSDEKPVGKLEPKDPLDSSAGSYGGIAVGVQAKVGDTAKNAIAIGTNSQALGKQSISIGTGNIVTGANSGAIGDPSTINASNSYSVGNDNTISSGSDESFILGNKVKIENSKEALALGSNSQVKDVAKGGVALGANSVANRVNNLVGYVPDGTTVEQKQAIEATTKGSLGSVSVGNSGETRQIINVAAGSADSDAVNVAQLKAVQAKVASAVNIASNEDGRAYVAPKSGRNQNNLALGSNSYAGGANSVALGNGSNTVIGKDKNGNLIHRDNTVSVGAPGTERTISNVAPGVLNSDAATMGQLRSGLYNVYKDMKEIRDDSRAGTAAAMAIGNLPQATIPGKGMLSLGGGYYESENAMAIGVSKMSDNGKWVFKAAGSYDSQENVGVAASIGFHF
ncbi:MAG: YadA-like family protein, partial [Campylobacter sp.]|nr:YadA-like family protein [Campylobacter sp.]